MMNLEANRTAYDFWREGPGPDQGSKLAEKLAPKQPPHPFGVKRPSLEQTYYDVFNGRTSGWLISKTPIVEVTPNGPKDGRGGT